jgi:hypothetical protein
VVAANAGSSAAAEAAAAVAAAAAAAAGGDAALSASEAATNAAAASSSSTANEDAHKPKPQQPFRWDIVALMLPPTGIGADDDLVPGMLRCLQKLLEPGPFWTSAFAALSAAQAELEDPEVADRGAERERTASALASGIFDAEAQKLPERAAALCPVVEAYLCLCATCRLLPVPCDVEGRYGVPAAAGEASTSSLASTAARRHVSPHKGGKDPAYALDSLQATIFCMWCR